MPADPDECQGDEATTDVAAADAWLLLSGSSRGSRLVAT
jgi:hypothetical protein